MHHLPRLIGLVVLALTLVVGAGVTQDTKKDDKKETKKAKGQLPQGFKDLGLTDEQKIKIYSLQGDYKGKIAELTKQINEMKKVEMQEIFKVLTEDQKKKYLDSKGVETKEKKKEPEKKPG